MTDVRQHGTTGDRTRTARLAVLCACLACAVAAAAPAPIDLFAPAAGVAIERDGRTPQAFATVAEALTAATAPCVVRLAPGTHRGPVAVTRPGIVLRGDPGARIDANNAGWQPQWAKTPAHGRLAYASPIPFAPGAVSVDDRLMIDARESRGGLALHDGGLGNDSRVPLQGVYTYVEKDRQLVVSFPDGASPVGRRFAASPRGVAAVTIRGANDCRVEGLIVTGGETGILLEQTTNSVVERCLVYATDVCVRLGQGAASCKVLSNDLAMNPDALNLDCDRIAVGKAVWHAHKRVGTYDKWSVLADQAGADNEVAYNYLHNGWDGVENLTGVGKEDVAAHYTNRVYKGIAPFNRGLRVHHNRVDLMMDDALEPNDQTADHQWYANFVTRARCAVRFKNISLGPLHFFDNVLLDSGTALRIYKSSPACADVFIYNNVVRDDAGIVYLEMGSVCWDDPWLAATLPRGTPSFRILNNVFVCDSPFANQASDVPPNFVSDHNLYTAPAAAAAAGFPPKGSDAHSLFDARPVFRDVANLDWRLADGSAGEGAGRALAGFLPAVPSGAAAFADVTAPDMGVLAVEAERARPNGPTSGLWELAAAQLRLGERDVADFALEDDPTPLRPLWGRGVPGTGPLGTKPAPKQTPPTSAPAEPHRVQLGDAPADGLRNGALGDFAHGVPAGWTLYGRAALTREEAEGGGRLRVSVQHPEHEQGSLSQTIAGLPADAKLVLAGKVRATKDGMAYLQIKLKDGRKEIGRHSSPKCGTDERELRVECPVGAATAVTVLCRFSQESAGESAWFSDLRLVASPAD
jgi:hypothetical protein